MTKITDRGRADYPLPALDIKFAHATAADVDRFVLEATNAGACVHRCTRQQIRSTLLNVLATQPPDASLLFERRELVQFVGWDLGTQEMCGCWMRDLREETRLTTRDFEIAMVAVGVTGADAGLADTGTLVLAASQERGRLLSLLPAVHVAILDVEEVLPDLASFLARPYQDSSAIMLITGPSKTADIEQDLTTGVHGPGELHVLLVVKE